MTSHDAGVVRYSAMDEGLEPDVQGAWVKYQDHVRAISECSSKWIPVSERKPEALRGPAREYLICSSIGYCTTLEWGRDGWQGIDQRETDDYWNKYVTHWMPLPEAPK